MPDPMIAASGGEVRVEHFYRQLASTRVAKARTALAAEPVDDAFARCAEAFEHAMTVAPSGGELAERLAEQAEALVWIAARFEQSADLEERRLFYVATTRAKDRLLITHVAERGRRATGGPSRFPSEAGLYEATERLAA